MKKTLCLILSVLLALLLLIPSVHAAELPSPAELNADVSAPAFAMTAVGGASMTSQNYGSGKNLLLVYGRITCPNTTSFLAGIQDGMDELSANGITVLVGLHNDPSDEQMQNFANTYKGIVCGKVSNSYDESGMWTGLAAVGAGTNSVIFPVVFLRSSDGKLRYYSTGYVDKPLSVVAAALVMKNGGSQQADPPKEEEEKQPEEQKQEEQQQQEEEQKKEDEQKKEESGKETTISKKPSQKAPKATGNGKIKISWKEFKLTKKTKATWNKIKKIEIQYSTDPTFTKDVIKKLVSKKKTELTVKRLKKKNTYYIRLRYVGNDTVSAWSNVKKIKVK